MGFAHACWCGRCEILIALPVPLKMSEYVLVVREAAGLDYGSLIADRS